MKKKFIIICIPILILALSAAIFFSYKTSKNKQTPAIICDGTKKAAVSPTKISSNNGSSPKETPSIPQDTVINTVGNTSGNLTNGGYAAEQDNWVYYSCDGIYKVMPDMEIGLQKISFDEGYCLNVVGDWLYYIDRYSHCLFKINTNGQSKTLVISDYCEYYVIKNNYIYYWTGYSSTKQCQLLKAKLGDVNGTYISDINGLDIPFTFDNNYMYWLSADAVSQTGCETLTRTNFDGKNKQLLTTTNILMPIASDGWIYYLNPDTIYDTLWRINSTGSGKEKLCSSCTLFNIKGDYIYYLDTNGNLYKMKKDGSNRTKYNIDIPSKLQSPSHLILTQDYILIFCDYPQAGCLKIKYDGSIYQLIQ